MSTSGQKFIFKIIVSGDSGVGKTSLMKKFTQGSFDKKYNVNTIGAQFSEYEKDIENDSVRLAFWNIAGSDDFIYLYPSFYKNTHAAIIVYSLEDNELGYESFNHIETWYNNIVKYCGQISIFLFANKVDLIDESKLDEVKLKEMVKRYDFVNYYKTSSLKGESVIEAFDTIIGILYNKYKKNQLLEEIK
ncbi:MAG: Rab family GTPase [Candidatus Hermodarchaeota archaeon]